MEVFYESAFKTLTVTLAFLLLITGCQAMTGATMGQNVDDGESYVMREGNLTSDKVVSLTRVGVETNNGIVYLTAE